MISVIVPIYNVSGYIGKCIESIINQTYDNLEIILVDDGSTDGSGQICEEFRKKDNRIIVIHKENGGLSDARNSGIEIAKGAYIGFVDGDDWIHPQMYEILYQMLIDNKVEMATCSFEREDENFGSYRYRDVDCKIVTRDEAISNLYITYVMAFNKLYIRELFDNIRYPVGKLHEDEYVIHKLLYKCNQIAVVKQKLYFYAFREGSIVSRMSRKRIDDSLEALKKRIHFAAEQQWNEAMVPVVSQYCDYCINWFWELEKFEETTGEYQEERQLLWRAEQDVLRLYPKIAVDKKYRVFAKDTKKYGKIVQRNKRIARIKTDIKAKLRKIGVRNFGFGKQR